MDDRNRAGLTLVELLIALAILGVLLAGAVPAMAHFMDRHRLRAAAETLAADLRTVRSEAIARGGASPLFVSFRPGHPWCYGLGDAPCNCRSAPSAPDACQASALGSVTHRIRDQASFPGVTLAAARFASTTDARFEGVRGLAQPGRVVLEGRDGQRLEVRVSLLGRVRICAPRDRQLAGYGPC